MNAITNKIPNKQQNTLLLLHDCTSRIYRRCQGSHTCTYIDVDVTRFVDVQTTFVQVHNTLP